MWSSSEIEFASDHPTAAGHFPGNPIIPGAVLMDAVIRAVMAGLDGPAQLCDIRSAKFLNPVRPGDRLLIRWRASDHGETRFECLLPQTDRLAASGTIALRKPTP